MALPATFTDRVWACANVTPPGSTVTAMSVPSTTASALADTVKLAKSSSRTVTVARLGEPASYLAGLAVSARTNAVTVAASLHDRVISGRHQQLSGAVTGGERHRRRRCSAEDPAGCRHPNANGEHLRQRGRQGGGAPQRKHRVSAL